MAFLFPLLSPGALIHGEGKAAAIGLWPRGCRGTSYTGSALGREGLGEGKDLEQPGMPGGVPARPARGSAPKTSETLFLFLNAMRVKGL